MAASKNNWHDAGQNCRSYLLRCWQEGELTDGKEPGEPLAWRFALIPVNDQSNGRGFACLEELCACLSLELAAETSEWKCSQHAESNCGV
jgi:hypothetical protein